MRIKRDDKRNLFWIVTSNSIAYMDEDYKITTIKNFPYANNFDLYENNQGEMWVLSSDGIYAVSVDELIANEQIDAVHFTLANGLQCTASSNSYSELTRAGDLYMAGTTGVVKVNINAPLDNISQIKVALPYLEADDQEIYADARGVFRIPAGVQKVTIHSNVLSFSLNDLQVSYKLEGFDKHTVTLKRSDMVPVDYTNLPGGEYKFMIHVSDSLGRGNKTVRYSIIKDRTVFEEPWFYLFVMAAGAAALWMLVRSILDRKQAAYEKSQAEAVEKERLNTELTTARAIQIGTMPHEFPPFPDRDEFEIYATVDPAREVGGDFYDYYMIDDDHLCLVIADVSGKGIPASLFMMISKVILQNCAMLGSQPGEILTRCNDAICSNNQADMFVTIWLGILEISTGILTCANAGHEYPAIMKNGKFSLFKDRHGLVIGGVAGVRYKEYELTLEPGDKLFVYTDGVPEATAADHRMFTTDRLIKALNEDPLAPVDHVLGHVQTALDEFVGGAEQFDDVTMLCFEYKGRKK
jgi:serine phosphatase RsbU (regulator of sigma subunit)